MHQRHLSVLIAVLYAADRAGARRLGPRDADRVPPHALAAQLLCNPAEEGVQAAVDLASRPRAGAGAVGPHVRDGHVGPVGGEDAGPVERPDGRRRRAEGGRVELGFREDVDPAVPPHGFAAFVALLDGGEVALRVLAEVDGALLVVVEDADRFGGLDQPREVLAGYGPYPVRAEVEGRRCLLECVQDLLGGRGGIMTHGAEYS